MAEIKKMRPRISKQVWLRIFLMMGSGLILLFLVAFLPSEHLIGFLFLGTGSLLVGWLAMRERRVSQQLVLGFAVRAALLLVHFFVYSLPGSGKDAVTFERIGWERAQDGLLATFQLYSIGSGTYYWFVSAVYSVIGRSAMAIAAINVILGTLIIWNAFRTAKLLWGRQAAVVAAWWIAILPNLVLNSALILREAFVAYFFSLAIYYFVRWTKTGRASSVIWSMVFVGLAATFHEGVFVAIPVIAGVAIWRSLRSSADTTGRIFVKPLLLIIIIILASGVMLSTSWGQFLTQSYLDRAEVEELGARQVSAARNRAAYPAALNVNGPVDIILKGPIRVVYFLFAPFPWMARDVIDLLGLLDSILYAYLIARIWRMRGAIGRNVSGRSLALVFVAVVAVFGLAVGNYGTAIRHRAKIVVIPIVLASAYRGLGRRGGGKSAVDGGDM